jgi:hypothetical protein
MSGLLYLLDVYDALIGASAVAASSLLHYILAAAFPLFINPSELLFFALLWTGSCPSSAKTTVPKLTEFVLKIV